MNRPEQPPGKEFFAAARPPAGEHAVGLRLGRLALELSGLDAALRDSLFDAYTPFSTGALDDPGALRLRLGLEERDYFIDPPPRTERIRVLLAYDAVGSGVRYLSYRVAGWFDADAGRGQVLLARGDFEPAARALENFVRAAVAWRAVALGGALVHAAGAVFHDRGYLFYGQSGAGKSTLAACNRSARFVGDDLALVLPGADGRLKLVGSPFRGTLSGGGPVIGGFPLAAGFRLVQATEAAVVPVARHRALGEFVGNMPFVAEACAVRPELLATVESALSGLPLAHLQFRMDDSYWQAIADWEAASGLAK